MNTPNKPRPWREGYNLWREDDEYRKRLEATVRALSAEVTRLTTELQDARDSLKQHREHARGSL